MTDSRSSVAASELLAGVASATVRSDLRPMMATSAERPFDDPAWSFEPKWDGVRALVHIDGGVRAISRNGNDITPAYPELAELSEVFGTDSVVDGEIVAFARGRPSFELLQSRMHVRDPARVRSLMNRVPIVFMAFDLLVDEGEDIMSLPLSARRSRLAASIIESEHVRLSPSVVGDGTALFDAARDQRLEGIVAKRLDSKYEPGKRSRLWRKVKVVHDVDAVVVGWRPGSGGRSGSLGSIALALYDGGDLRYIGSVGSGFDGRSLGAMAELLEHYTTDDPPLVTRGIPAADEVTWVRPELVAVVEYREVTSTMHLRAPVFKGMRSDKAPEECTIDGLAI